MRSARAVLFLLALSMTPRASAACGIEPTLSSWTLNATVLPAPLFACPLGDTPSFIDQGWWIGITAIDCSGYPVPSIPASDIWIVDELPEDLVFCNGAWSSNADSATNAAGMTTMSNTTLAAGGCADGMAVVVQGYVIADPDYSWKIGPIFVRSPDIDASSSVDLTDLSIFAAHFNPGPYDACCDFNLDGVIGIQDTAMFAAHFGPPGHSCNQ